MKTVKAFLLGATFAYVAAIGTMGYLRRQERTRWDGVVRAERDSTAAWRTRAEAFKAQMAELRADSAALYGDWRAADSAADAAAATLEPIFVMIPDTGAQRRAREAAVTLRLPARSCSLVVVNCEARARAAETAQADAEARATSLAAKLDTTDTKLKRAERDADRRFFVGVGAGYGATLSGGRVVTGPTLQVGVQYRFRPEDLVKLLF